MQTKQGLYIFSVATFWGSVKSTALAATSVSTFGSSGANDVAAPQAPASLPEAPTIFVAVALLVLPFGLCAIKSLVKART